MTIKVNLSSEESTGIKVNLPADDLKVKIKDPPRLLEFDLNLRRALNGDLMIFDHADIDIIVMLEKKKIVAFAKDLMTEVVYGAESRLFDHLKKKGIVAFDSIQGGNVYGSLEATLLDSKELDSVKASLYEISKWMDSERPYFEAVKAHDEMMDDEILNPEGDDATELGDVPHEEEKGSIKQHNLFSPYLYGRYTY
tara:strand:+ start:68 stop:655 length:588 start_codon:yes stop_codon:yes gene_type:complete